MSPSVPRRVLLDTNALIWALSAPQRLSVRAREVVEDPSRELVVSAASVWETATKHRLGRWPEVDVIVSDMRAHLRRLGATELPISASHALLAGSMTWTHKDPFDRMLVAQATLDDLPVVTADRAIRGFDGVHTLW